MVNRDPSPVQVLTVQIVVSASAIGGLLAHIFLPGFSLDFVAVALLGIAVLPWLGVLIESFEFGGAKVRYRQLHEKVQEVEKNLVRTQESLGTLDTRMGKVESFVFSGAASPEQQADLSAALSAYRQYLAQLGIEPGPVLRIHVDNEESPYAAYPDPENGRFVIGVALANQPDALLHEYTHHLLATLATAERANWDLGIAGIESGLAYYLPSSAGQNHVHAGMYDLSAPPRPDIFTPNPAHRDGLHWASAFWELRAGYGSAGLDRSLLEAWQTAWEASQPDGHRFLEAFRASGSVPARAIDAALQRNGVPNSGRRRSHP